jgi:ATP-dependent DNA helicase PIF1
MQRRRQMTSTLNPEQAAALAAVKKGRNIFLTGAGGTGKSHTIHAIYDWATKAGMRIAVTAMTGCAALLLGNGAKTLHSWAGVGLARESPEQLATMVAKNKRATRRWTNTQILIIDEVSMMTPEFLDKLDLVGRRVRKRASIRFGGLQLVLAGDFCQLPPVNKGGGNDEPTQFIFEAPLWSSLVDEVHELTTLVRQKEPVFQQVLTEARMGRLSPESIKVLQERKGLAWHEMEIRPTLLFNRNAEVDTVNRVNMASLEGERHTYDAQDVQDPSKRSGVEATAPLMSPDDPDIRVALTRLDNDAPYDNTLELCVGAQVMLITNMDQDAGLVNGSRGVITGYSLSGLPIVRFLGNKDPVIVDRANWWLADYPDIGRSQIPLRIAYAVTTHKAQGATLDVALVDIGPSTFEYGQAYVALSRVRSLGGLYVHKFDPRKIRCHPAVAAFYDGLAAKRAAPTTNPLKAEPSETSEDDPTSIDDPVSPLPWSTAGLSPQWTTVINAYMVTPEGQKLIESVTERAEVAQIQPQPTDVFAALRACPDPATIRVIILGQDPYPTAGNAHGLAFSVPENIVKLPPSLQNIFKELKSDLSLASTPETGCLQAWTKQGVLLLNDVLTVTVGAPLSHAGIGWEALTAKLLATALTASPHTVVIAWGRNAQKKLDNPIIKPLLSRHTVIQAAHPSPLSAHTGFFGSKPFSQTNKALQAHGQQAIDWLVS